MKNRVAVRMLLVTVLGFMSESHSSDPQTGHLLTNKNEYFVGENVRVTIGDINQGRRGLGSVYIFSVGTNKPATWGGYTGNFIYHAMPRNLIIRAPITPGIYEVRLQFGDVNWSALDFGQIVAAKKIKVHANPIAGALTIDKKTVQVGDTLTGTFSVPPLEEKSTTLLLARMYRFSLHAAAVCEAHQRSKLERLCRYITRPPIATKHLSADNHGRAVYRYKRPFRDGLTLLVLEP